MPTTTLSNGVDLDALSAADLAVLVLQAQKLRAGIPIDVPDKGDTRTSCIVSPHTGACTRCGHPGGAPKCEALISVQYAATLAMRAARPRRSH